MPPNEVEVKLIFTRRRSAKIMGKLAEPPASADDDDDGDGEGDEGGGSSSGKVAAVEPREGDPVRGILVTQQNSSKIVSPEDLSTYTPLRVGSVSSRLHVPFVGKIATLRLFLNEMFRGIRETTDAGDDDDDEGEDDDDDDAATRGDRDDDEGMDESARGVVTFSMHGGQVRSVSRRKRA
jgi:cleavage and polyadenylation specificity factor subunit 3